MQNLPVVNYPKDVAKLTRFAVAVLLLALTQNGHVWSTGESLLVAKIELKIKQMVFEGLQLTNRKKGLFLSVPLNRLIPYLHPPPLLFFTL